VTAELAVWLAWLVWWISWMAAAAWTGRTVQRPGGGSEVLYRLLGLVGIVLLFGLYPHVHSAELALWEVGDGVAWSMVALAVLGFVFAWWARLHLGALWSSSVTRKADHHLVDTGPYGLVRHPIYTGVILAALATAVLRGTALSLLGAALMTLGWYVKARLEERFLREQLGAEIYDAYSRHTPMLIPFTQAR